MRVMAHSEIKGFFAYKAGYTRKMPSKSRMRLHSMFFKCSNYSNLNLMCMMVLEWREHENGDVEEAVRGDLMAQQALRTCKLYMFWCLGGLRAKPRLL